MIELNNKIISETGLKATIDFYQTMSIEQLKIKGIKAFATGVDSPFLNVAIIIDNFNSSDLQEKIRHFFQEKQLPWCVLTTNKSFAAKIKSAGLNLLEAYPNMYHDLSELVQKEKNEISQIIEQVDDLSNWIKPIKEGFPSSDNCEAFRKLNARLLAEDEKKLRHFSAFQNSEIAASATLFLSNDCVMLHNLATRNKFRGQGIGKALSSYLMFEAKKLGYKNCFLDSSEEAFSLYSKLGFKTYSMTYAYN